jgi:hypothetical protein
MNTPAFEFGEHLKLREVSYKLSDRLWNKYDCEGLNLDFPSEWSQLKFLNADATSFSDDIHRLPNDKGGVYMFFVKCHILPGITEFPLYIGRARLTDGHNIRVRIRAYFTKYRNGKERRPLILKMIKYWGKELYIAFRVLDDNQEIVDLERKLINGLLLPMNTEIPDTEIRSARDAF